jgi:catechol 2,3-dioxygenase-like lactoylglutathione lyase family enzyme
MITGIDHVVILVNELEQGIDQYRRLGFNVTPGGKHPRFTHNALVPFADGSYLELIAFWEQPEEGGDMHRWYRYLAAGGGLIDFALASDNLEADIHDIASRGLRYDGPNPGARSRPDGQQVAWKMGWLPGDNPGAVPFLIEDVTPRSLRVPSGEAARHENGVRGIRSLAVAVRDQQIARQRYQQLLGRDEPDGTGLKNLENADGVYFLVGPHRIDLASPTGPGPLADQLARRGDSLYELTLLGPTNVDIDPSQAGGARLRIVAG